MLKFISVNNSNLEPGLAALLKDYGFNVVKTSGNLGVVLPDCPVRPATLLRANIRPWTYFNTIVKIRRHYMGVYKQHANTSWEYSEDAKQVVLAINALSALSHHMSEKIVRLLLLKSAKSAEKVATAGDLNPEMRRHVSMLSYSPEPLDTCQEVVRMCIENYGGRSIKHPDALVNKHLGVYAKFSTVT